MNHYKTAFSTLRKGIRPIARAVAEIVEEWSREGRSPAEIRLVGKLAKPIRTEFAAKHCEIENGSPAWVSRLRWKTTLRARRELEVAMVAGPSPEENYVVRIRENVESELEHFFARLRRML